MSGNPETNTENTGLRRTRAWAWGDEADQAIILKLIGRPNSLPRSLWGVFEVYGWLSKLWSLFLGP